jgi:hypothetical protein
VCVRGKGCGRRARCHMHLVGGCTERFNPMQQQLWRVLMCCLHCTVCTSRPTTARLGHTQHTPVTTGYPHAVAAEQMTKAARGYVATPTEAILAAAKEVVVICKQHTGWREVGQGGHSCWLLACQHCPHVDEHCRHCQTPATRQDGYVE